MTIHPPTIYTVHFWGSLNNSQWETADSSSFASSAAMTVVYSKWECLFFILEHRENATWRSFAAALCVYMASTQKAPHHQKGGRQETHLVIYSTEEVSRKATYISTRTQKCTAHRQVCFPRVEGLLNRIWWNLNIEQQLTFGSPLGLLTWSSSFLVQVNVMILWNGRRANVSRPHKKCKVIN